MGHAKRHAAAALRRVLEHGDGLDHLFARFHARNHYAAHAEVEHPGHGNEVHVRYAAERNYAGAAARDHHRLKQADVATAVLHIVKHELHSGGGQHGRDTGSEQLQHDLPEDYLARAQFLFHGIHGSPRLCRRFVGRLPIAVELGAKTRTIENLAIDYVRRSLSMVDRQRSSAADLAHVAEKFTGPADRVGCQDDVVEAHKWRVGIERLGFEYIERGPAYRAFLQCVDQSGFIDDWPAGSVDQESIAPHQPQLAP